MNPEHIDRIASVLERVEERIESIDKWVSTAKGDTTGDRGRQNAETSGPINIQERSRFGKEDDTGLFDLLFQHIMDGRLKDDIELDPDAEETRHRLNQADDPVCTMSFDGEISYANQAMAMLFELTPADLSGTPFHSLILPEYRYSLEARLNELARKDRKTQTPTGHDILLLRAETGSGHWVSIECILLCWRHDGRRGLIAILRDIQKVHTMLDTFRRTRRDYDALAETITEAVLQINEEYRIVYANSAVEPTFGYKPINLVQRPLRTLFPKGEFERHETLLRKYFMVDEHDRDAAGLARSVEVLGTRRDGTVFPMELTAGNSKQKHERTLTLIVRDISERKTTERRLRNLAYHDQLTGTGNRDLFYMNLRSAIESAGKSTETPAADPNGAGDIAVMFLDLDGFKQINDALGHEAGDRLLVEAAMRLRRTLPSQATVYRFGGDEFVVLLPEIENHDSALETARSLLSAILKPFQLQTESNSSQTATVGVSIGTAFFPAHATTIDFLVRAADMAMYNAKNHGKSRVSVFSPELDSQNAFRWDLKQGLQHAMEHGELFLHYQPLVTPAGQPEGFEALLRWQHPVRGAVAPDTFISIAEEVGMIVTLGNWVIQRACWEFSTLPPEIRSGKYLAVNISPRQLEDDALFAEITEVVDTKQIPASKLCLEITETSLMDAPEEGIERLRTLKASLPDLQIVIDNFGKGFSSLNYLSRFPVDALKIDHSFVYGLSGQTRDTNLKIIRAIIRLAHSLELSVIAEGIETDEQWHLLVNEECDTLQGFRFGEATAAESLSNVASFS